MVKVSAEYERSICLISDLHVGSRYALCPEKWLSREGGSFDSLMIDAQRKLLEYWNDFTYKMRHDFKIDTVFIVGDVCAGVNPKQYGAGLITSDLTEQVEGAIKLLTPLCKGRKVHVWSGSLYHEDPIYQIHKDVADAFNGTFHGYLANLKLTPSNKIAFVTHESSIAPVYPETATARDLMHMAKALMLEKIPKINVVIRAHRHISDYKHKKDFHFINLPCWCCFTPYPRIARYYFLMQPDIGGALLLLEKKTHRIRVIMFDDYPVPHVADTVKFA